MSIRHALGWTWLPLWLAAAAALSAGNPALTKKAAAKKKDAPAEIAKNRHRQDDAPQAELLPLLAGHGVEEIVFSIRQPGKDGHWYANFGYYAADEKQVTYGSGGRLCRMNLKTGAVTTLLDAKTGSIRDPAVDYDAHKILFSYRKDGGANYNLYDMNADGGNLAS